MGYYNDLSLSYGADDAHYDRIDYGMSYCGNSTTGADQGLDIDPDANDGSGDILVDEAHALVQALNERLAWAVARGFRGYFIALILKKAERRYQRRLAAIQPAPQVDDDGTDLPF